MSASFLVIFILLIILGMQFFKHSLFIAYRWYFMVFLPVLITYSYLFWLAYKQYSLWLNNDLAKYFLPPYNSFNYFVNYSFSHIWGDYFVSLIVASFISLSALLLNRFFTNRFFYEEEPFLIFAVFFLVGHPGWLFLLVLILFCHAIISILVRLIIKHPTRLPFYHLWVPTALFVIIISSPLSDFSWWHLLNF